MSQLHRQTPVSATRAAANLDSLLTLSRALAGSCQDGLTSDTLDMLLAATGYTRGAAFVLRCGALELVAHRGLPDFLRGWIARLPLMEPSWFLAQVAVHARALVSAHTVSTSQSTEVSANSFAAAGWAQAVACPISAAREIHGVIMLASPAAAEPDEALKAAVEIACRLLALQIPRRNDEVRTDGAGAAQMAALAVLTCGFASELSEQLNAVQRHLARQEQLAARLKRSGPAGVALDIEAMTRSAATALRQAEEITARLLSTFQSAFPVSPGEESYRESGPLSGGGLPAILRATPGTRPPASQPPPRSGVSTGPAARASLRLAATEPAFPAALAERGPAARR